MNWRLRFIIKILKSNIVQNIYENDFSVLDKISNKIEMKTLQVCLHLLNVAFSVFEATTTLTLPNHLLSSPRIDLTSFFEKPVHEIFYGIRDNRKRKQTTKSQRPQRPL